jgi:hypothetical protein
MVEDPTVVAEAALKRRRIRHPPPEKSRKASRTSCVAAQPSPANSTHGASRMETFLVMPRRNSLGDLALHRNRRQTIHEPSLISVFLIEREVSILNRPEWSHAAARTLDSAKAASYVVISARSIRRSRRILPKIPMYTLATHTNAKPAIKYPRQSEYSNLKRVIMRKIAVT